MKNRKLASALFIVIIILAAAPYFVGIMARGIIEKQAREISRIPGYSLNITDYDQGWFSSHARIAYGFDQHTLDILTKPSSENQELDQQTLKALKQGLIFDVTISHGPVTFQQGVHFALLTLSGTLRDIDHDSYKKFKEKANIDNLLKLFVLVSYNGATEIKLNSPAFNADYSDIAGQPMIIDSAGMDFQASINGAFDHYEAKAHLDKIKIKARDGIVNINQLSLQAGGDRINNYLWTGNGRFSLGEFSIKEPENTLLSLTRFDNSYTLARENDTALAIHISAKVGALVGKDMKIKDVLLDLDINHLDIAAITDYVKSIQQSYQLPDGTEPTAEQNAKKIQEIVTWTGERLVKSSPELAINNLSLQLNGGSFRGDGMLSINGQGLKNIQQLSDPVALNKRLVSRVNLKFDRKMARAIILLELKKRRLAEKQLDQAATAQTTVFLQNFITHGYLKQEGDNYSVLFELKNGQRMINGKPLPIPGM